MDAPTMAEFRARIERARLELRVAADALARGQAQLALVEKMVERFMAAAAAAGAAQ